MRAPLLALALILGGCGAKAGGATPTGPVGIGVVRVTPWSAGDSTREGAAELAVAIRVAQLQRTHPAVGLICIGDRHGTLEPGGERALRRAAISGVLIVRLSSGDDISATPDRLFLEGRGLSPATAAELLTALIARHGPPPVAANPDHPLATELAAIRAHLTAFQIGLAAGARENLLASVK
jgi:hypothetical protein